MAHRLACAAVLGAALLTAPACSQGVTITIDGVTTETIDGSGVAASQEWEISDFHALDVGGMYQVDVQVGPAPSLTIETDDNLLELVTVEQEDGTLRLGLDKGIRTDIGLRARLTTPTLDALDVSGVCRVNVVDADTEHFALDVSGASRATIAGRVGSALIDSSGTAQANVDLAGGLVEISGSGASKVALGGAVKDARVSLSGTSRLEAGTLSGGTLDADLTGASRLTFAGGSAAEARIDASGTGKARLEALSVRSLIVDLSGAANVSVGDTGSLQGEASGASRLEYGGSPGALSVETSGAARIRRR